uniref:CCHC-type domain-containing protein n=1 Tax=Tanacetum cinerariifolium TaxID=118510 RepID=A0A6L2M8C6_TANCI|nr:hypothetical protein [Tanacetum cinerariifolium]
MDIADAFSRLDIADTNVSAPYLDPSQMVIAWDMENCHMDIADAFSSLDIADTNVSAPYLDASQMVIAWDMENCHVSTESGITIAQASVNITKARKGLEYGGIKFITTFSESAEAVHKMIIIGIFEFAFECPPTAYIMLISADANFTNTFYALRELGYTVILVVPKGHVSPVLMNSSDFVFSWPRHDTLILWDMISCPIPNGMMHENLVSNITNFIKTCNSKNEGSAFHAYGGDSKLPSIKSREKCIEMGVKFFDKQEAKHEALDKTMLLHMLVFAYNNRASCTILAITNDESLSSAFYKLEARGYNVNLVVPSKNDGLGSSWIETNLFEWNDFTGNEAIEMQYGTYVILPRVVILWKMTLSREAIKKPISGYLTVLYFSAAEGLQLLKSFYCQIDKDVQRNQDKFQKLISQLELKGEVISQEDANMKLLKSLPPAWNNIALIMRNKPDIETLSMDDLYNNLKVYEAEIKGQSSSGSNSHNIAFMSFKNTSSINETVTAAHDIFDAGLKEQPSASSYVDDVMFSFFASQYNTPQLDNEDLEQIDTNDLEEMDLKWQVAMITVRVKKFMKRIRRNLNFNGKEPVGFDKTKVKCYNCHRRRHFARECHAPKTQGNMSADNERRFVLVETPASALVVQDGLGGYDWSYQAEEGPTDFALMAHSSDSANSSNSEVQSCSNECLQSFKNLQKQYDQQKEILNRANLEILASDSSVSEIDEDSNQAKDRYKVGIGYHAVPPLYIENYMPQRADLCFAGLDDFVFKFKISETRTSVNENESIASKSNEETREEPKTVRHIDYALWEVIMNDDAPASIASVSGGVEAAIPPKTTKQKIARRNELKAKSTLLLAISNEHLLNFHGIKDANTLWEAIKTRFGGPADQPSQTQDRLNFFKNEFAPIEKWMNMPEIGFLIASHYNVIFHNITTLGSMTYLPLRLIPPPWYDHKFITLRSECAVAWITPYLERINYYNQLLRSNISNRNV